MTFKEQGKACNITLNHGKVKRRVTSIVLQASISSCFQKSAHQFRLSVDYGEVERRSLLLVSSIHVGAPVYQGKDGECFLRKFAERNKFPAKINNGELVS